MRRASPSRRTTSQRPRRRATDPHRIAEVAKTDLDVPFVLYWNYPSVPAGSGLLQPYVFRTDFVSAFDNAINQGLTRTSFNGYRTPKP